MSEGDIQTVYSIKCLITKKYYVGVTSSKAVGGTLEWILRTNRKTPTRYVAISESVHTHGKRNHQFTVMSKHETREAAELSAYKYRLKLSELGFSLNDEVINPEKVKCDICQMSYRLAYKKEHDEKYCSAVVIKELDDLLERLQVE